MRASEWFGVAWLKDTKREYGSISKAWRVFRAAIEGMAELSE
jgi:hypothetical protein